MTRNRNQLQRHIQDCLLDRIQCREWLKAARARSPWMEITEQDWMMYGNIPIDQWLIEKSVDEYDPRDGWDESEWWDWGEETYGALELYERALLPGVGEDERDDPLTAMEGLGPEYGGRG